MSGFQTSAAVAVDLVGNVVGCGRWNRLVLLVIAEKGRVDGSVLRPEPSSRRRVGVARRPETEARHEVDKTVELVDCILVVERNQVAIDDGQEGVLQEEIALKERN